MVTMDGTDIPPDRSGGVAALSGLRSPGHLFFFQGTLRDNVTMGVHEIDDHSAFQAAEIAGVNEFAKEHPPDRYESLRNSAGIFRGVSDRA